MALSVQSLPQIYIDRQTKTLQHNTAVLYQSQLIEVCAGCGIFDINFVSSD